MSLYQSQNLKLLDHLMSKITNDPVISQSEDQELAQWGLFRTAVSSSTIGLNLDLALLSKLQEAAGLCLNLRREIQSMKGSWCSWRRAHNVLGLNSKDDKIQLQRKGAAYDRSLQDSLGIIEQLYQKQLESTTQSQVQNWAKAYQFTLTIAGQAAAQDLRDQYILHSLTKELYGTEAANQVSKIILAQATQASLIGVAEHLKLQDKWKFIYQYHGASVNIFGTGLSNYLKNKYDKLSSSKVKTTIRNFFNSGLYFNLVCAIYAMGQWFEGAVLTGAMQGLHTDSMLAVIRKILGTVYNPLVQYYVEIFALKEKLEESEKFDLLEKMKFTIKLGMPLVLILITFFHFEPLFNDFMLFFIIPAFASFSIALIKNIINGVQSLLYKTGLVNEFANNKRLNNIFGLDASKKVAKFYEYEIGHITLELNKLDMIIKSGEVRSDGPEIKKHADLRNNLAELKLEWRILSKNDPFTTHLHNPELRTYFLARLAKHMKNKLEKQQRYLKQTIEYGVEGVEFLGPEPRISQNAGNTTPKERALVKLDSVTLNSRKIFARQCKLDSMHQLAEKIDSYSVPALR